MLRAQILFGVVSIILFSSPSRGLKPPPAVLEPNIMLEDGTVAKEATTPPPSLPPSAHPPLGLVGLGATAVTALRGRERVVVLDTGDEKHGADAPLPCSPSPDPVLLEAGQTVALKGSLGHLPRPCKWLFQFQKGTNVINEEFSDQTNEGYSNLTNEGVSNLTNEGVSNLTNVEYLNLTGEGYSNQTNKVHSNVTKESGSNHPTDDSLAVTAPVGILELVCGELILVGKEEIDVEPDEEDETTGKSGRRTVGGGVEDASEQFDEVKCMRGNYLVISDERDRRDRICGYLQDFTWRSETGVLRVRLRARTAGGGMGDFEMGGCSVSAI